MLATALSTVPAAPQPSGDAASCAALQGKKITPDTVIESAQWRPDGDTVVGTLGSVSPWIWVPSMRLLL